MRIALVLDRFEPARGGVEQWTARYASALVRDGREVHVVARSFAATGDPELDRAIKTHAVPGHAGKLTFATNAEEVLRGLDVDVIHDMGFGWYADVIQPHGGSRAAAGRRNRAMRGPVLGGLRTLTASLTPREQEFRAVARRQYGESFTDRGAKRFVAISRMVAGDLIDDYGVDGDAVKLVYNGIDTRRFTPADRDRWRAEVRGALDVGPGCVFLIAAHHLKLKGLPTLLRAFAKVTQADPTARLVVAGGRKLRGFKLQASRLGVADAVRWVGPIDD
ncbi:MAG: glycosyltransferase family 4 protein, partial [Planctomycetota bacterium]